MSTSPEEQKDLVAMKAKELELIRSNYDIMREYTRMDEAQLKTCGHKTVEGALLYSMNSTMKDIKKLHDAHIKKWPD